MKVNTLKTVTILLFLAGSFSSCHKNEDETDISIKTQYYWSDGKKIWLDTDYSVMIVRFDNEQSLDDYLSSTSTASKLSSQPAIACVRRQSKSDKETFQKLETNKSVISMVFGNRFHNSETPFYLTGNILFHTKEGISAENILQKFKIDGEIINVIGETTVVVQLNDWNTIFNVANAIYESGMVNWCHPDFFSFFYLMTYFPKIDIPEQISDTNCMYKSS